MLGLESIGGGVTSCLSLSPSVEGSGQVLTFPVKRYCIKIVILRPPGRRI